MGPGLVFMMYHYMQIFCLFFLSESQNFHLHLSPSQAASVPYDSDMGDGNFSFSDLIKRLKLVYYRKN